MFSEGLKASELIAELQKIIQQHGDRHVYIYAGDYPGGVGGVSTIDWDDPYVPKDVFILWKEN